MKMIEKSYKGHFSRPRPEIFVEEEAGFLVVATPWGSRDGARKAIQSLADFYLAAKDDVEVTSPFQKLTCLSPIANALRAAVMLTNDLIYQDDNRNEYTVGIELFVAAKKQKEISFVQIGHPQIFIDRQGHSPFTVGTLTDLSLDFSQPNKKSPPLPNHLLGTHSTCSPNIRSLRVHEEDRLILVSHSFLPSAFYLSSFADRSLDKLANTIAKSSPQDPFWLGQITF